MADWTYDDIAEYHFKAWIGSYGNYNAGILKGDWLEFPVPENKLDLFLEKVVGINEFNEEVMINDYDGNLFDLGESEDVYAINYAAMIWESLNDWQKNAVVAYSDHEGFLSLKELMNVMLQADNIAFYPYSADLPENWEEEEKIGYTFAETFGLYSRLEEMGSLVLSCFDFKEYGRQMAMDLTLYDKGYFDNAMPDLNLDFWSREELAEEARKLFEKGKKIEGRRE